MYGKGLNIHDRSKSGSLIDMTKWSVGPSGRWEDNKTGYTQSEEPMHMAYGFRSLIAKISMAFGVFT